MNTSGWYHSGVSACDFRVVTISIFHVRQLNDVFVLGVHVLNGEGPDVFEVWGGVERRFGSIMCCVPQGFAEFVWLIRRKRLWTMFCRFLTDQ